MEEHFEKIYGKNMNEEELEYNYSSVDDSNISDTNFGCSEDEQLILTSLKIMIQVSVYIPIKNYIILNML